MAMVAIEKELIEASGFKVKKYTDRQDYLLAITRAVAEITDDDFEGLSKLAARWYDMAAANVNSNEDILEFKDTPAKDPDEEDEEETEEETAEDEGEEAEETEEANPDEDTDDDEEEGEAEDSDDDESEEADESDEEEADEADEEEAEEDEPEPEPAPKKKAKAKAAPAVEEAAPEKPAKVKAKAKTPPRGPKDPDPALIKKFREQEIAENKRKGKKDRLPKTRYDEMIGVKNRYGYYEGTKTDEALKMFEKGAKMSDVTAYLGDTYYNALRRLKAEGHLVERLDDGKLKLTHKDDMGGKKAKAK